MKQTRRKELKTNDLRAFLTQAQEAIQRNANYILIGLAAVVLILVVGLYVQHNRHAAVQAAWNTYNEIREQNVIAKPEALDQATNFAAQQGSNPDIGPMALQLQGDLAYQLAMNLSEEKDRARRSELLKTARGAFKAELDRFSDRPDVRARACMSLAAVEETLIVTDEGSVDEARKYYQQVIDSVVDGRPTAWQSLAQNMLGTLNDRVSKLQVVATRPAATMPSTQPVTTTPAALTRPQISSRPAATAPR